MTYCVIVIADAWRLYCTRCQRQADKHRSDRNHNHNHWSDSHIATGVSDVLNVQYIATLNGLVAILVMSDTDQNLHNSWNKENEHGMVLAKL